MARREEPNRTKDIQLGLRMSADEKASLHALAEHHGISMADVITMLIRKEIRREGVQVLPLSHYVR